MFKRYRNYGPPLVVALFIFVALYAASQTGEEGGSTDSNQNYSATTDQKTNPVLPPPVVGFLPPVNGVEARYDPNKTGEYDLTAQRWMSWFTGIIALLTGSGVLLIWGTLRETGQVLDEARKTTKAANRTVDETRRIGEAQVRAYLSVERAEVVYCGPQALPSVELFVRNSGNSPASSVSLMVNIYDQFTGAGYDAWNAPSQMPQLTQMNAFASISAGETKSVQVELLDLRLALKPDGEEFRKMKAVNLFAEGYFVFETVFHQPRDKNPAEAPFSFWFSCDVSELIIQTRDSGPVDPVEMPNRNRLPNWYEHRRWNEKGRS